MTMPAKKFFVEEWIGRTVESWTVVSGSHTDKHGHIFWVCRCICGREAFIDCWNLAHGKTKNCNKGVCWSGVNSPNYGKGKYDPSLPMPGWAYANAKLTATRRNLVWEVPHIEASNVLEKQKFICALSGVCIQYALPQYVSTASYDRIDSSLGYVTGNVQFVHKMVNSMKSNHNEQDFIDMCLKIAEYRGQ